MLTYARITFIVKCGFFVRFDSMVIIFNTVIILSNMATYTKQVKNTELNTELMVINLNHQSEKFFGTFNLSLSYKITCPF